MSIRKIIACVICAVLLIGFLLGATVKGESVLAFTMSNKSGTKTASGDSFNEAYNLFCEYATTFTYLNVNRDADISADELRAYNRSMSVRSTDDPKTLNFVSSTSKVHISQRIVFNNILVDFNSCISYFMVELKNSTVYNMGSCDTYLLISADSTIIIDDETVFSGDIVIKNGAALTLIFNEGSSLSADKITVEEGSIVLSGSGLSDGSAPFVSNIDADYVSSDGYDITKIDNYFYLSAIKEEELSSTIDDESSAPDSSSISDGESSAPDSSSILDDESSAPDSSSVSDDETSAPDSSSVSDDETSAPDSSSILDDESSAPDSSSISDDESSAPDSSSISDGESSAPDGSSVSDGESSAPDSSSILDDESSAPDSFSISDDESSAPDSSVNLVAAEQIEIIDVPVALAQENPGTGRTNAFVGGFIFFAVVGAVVIRKE